MALEIVATGKRCAAFRTLVWFVSAVHFHVRLETVSAFEDLGTSGNGTHLQLTTAGSANRVASLSHSGWFRHGRQGGGGCLE